MREAHDCDDESDSMKHSLTFHCLHRKARILLLLAMAGILSFAVPRAFAGPSDSVVITVHIDPFPPDAVTDLATSTTSVEGEIQLEWTAPADPPRGGAATSYQVRYATYSVDDLLGNTTAWWNAVIEAVGEPSPSSPGTPESFTIGSLEPGVTYYFGIRSTDTVNHLSAIDDYSATTGLQAASPATDLKPSSPTALSASVISATDVLLEWNAVIASDLDFYRLHVDSTSPYDFSDKFMIDIDSTSISFTHTGLTTNSTYSYFITAIDKGVPIFSGPALESSPSSTIIVTPRPDAISPAIVAGLSGELSGDGQVFTIGWSTVATNANGSPITDLTLYRVLKSTGLFAPTTATFNLSPPQTSFTDTVNNKTFYYKMRAVDINGNESQDSNIITSQSDPDIVALGDDGKTRLMVPKEISAELHKENNSTGSDLVIVATRLKAEEKNNVLKSYLFEVRRAENYQPVSKFSFAKPMLNVKFGFVTGGGMGSLARDRKRLSIYWDNSARFISLGGDVNFAEGTISVVTSNVGRYQLRMLKGAESVITDGSPYPRVITPNGDGVNDRVFFFFETTDSLAKGRIYDLNGAFVGSMKPGPVQDASLVWDGKDDRDNVVPMGVYLYKVTVNNESTTGTIVVAR